MKNSTKVIKSKKTDTNNLDYLDNLDNQIHMLNETEIDIHKLIDDLQNIGDEKNKEEFIKNYSKIKEQIKIVDEVLFNNGENDENDENDKSDENDKGNEFKSKTINELLSALEHNEDKIFNSSNLTVGELKSLMEICNVLEKKINDETMNIIEIK